MKREKGMQGRTKFRFLSCLCLCLHRLSRAAVTAVFLCAISSQLSHVRTEVGHFSEVTRLAFLCARFHCSTVPLLLWVGRTQSIAFSTHTWRLMHSCSPGQSLSHHKCASPCPFDSCWQWFSTRVASSKPPCGVQLSTPSALALYLACARTTFGSRRSSESLKWR